MTSVYIEHDPSVTPKRFVYTNAESLVEASGSPSEPVVREDQPLKVAEEFHVDHEVGYQLVVLDAALGSRFYGLSKRTEVDRVYKLINNDPFNGSTSVAAGLTFIDENLGFTALSHSGGIYADLFRSADGVERFEKIEWPDVEVPLNADEAYNPFDFPEMPYVEGEKLVMYVNQGADDDYKN